MIKNNLILDRLGICLSICCGVHCLATTFFLAAGALEMFNLIFNEKFELAMSIGLLLIGMVAMLPQLVVQRTYGLLGLFTSGFVLLKIGEEMTVPWMQVILLTTGVLALTSAHYLNIKSKRKHAKYIKAAKEVTRYRS